MKPFDFIKLFSSERRLEMLEALLRGENAEAIRTRFPGSTYAYTLNTLKTAGMVSEMGREISITAKGRASLITLAQANESLATFDAISRFYHDHDIELPDEFYSRLYQISDIEPVVSDPSDVLKPHRIFSEHILRSREIYGVSPLIYPDYPTLFAGIIESATIISLVVTEEIFQVISEYPLEGYENLEIYVIDRNPKIAVTVTDTFLSIGFFYRSGLYDFSRDLIATSPSALNFGRDLVEYYRRQARKVI